jgi:hypothetical protein
VSATSHTVSSAPLLFNKDKISLNIVHFAVSHFKAFLVGNWNTIFLKNACKSLI